MNLKSYLAGYLSKIAEEGQTEPKFLETPEFQKKLAKRLVDNPNPEDDVVHGWAGDLKVKPEDLEEEIYKLATLYAKFMLGGKSNEKGFKEEDADNKQLEMGVKVEAEHSSDLKTRKKISLDHLAESDKKYYTHLKEMEDKYNKGKKE